MCFVIALSSIKKRTALSQALSTPHFSATEGVWNKGLLMERCQRCRCVCGMLTDGDWLQLLKNL
jgi:hypothetical protein